MKYNEFLTEYSNDKCNFEDGEPEYSIMKMWKELNDFIVIDKINDVELFTSDDTENYKLYALTNDKIIQVEKIADKKYNIKIMKISDIDTIILQYEYSINATLVVNFYKPENNFSIKGLTESKITSVFNIAKILYTK